MEHPANHLIQSSPNEQTGKQASLVHHEPLPVLSNHLPQKRWRAFSTGKPLHPGSSPLTWDQLRIVTSKSSKIYDPNPSRFRSQPYFFNVYHFLGTNHVSFIHISVSCHNLPEHGRKTPKHKSQVLEVRIYLQIHVSIDSHSAQNLS